MLKPGGMALDALESEVQELMALMDPSYLGERSEAAEAMRRLLFAGAMLMATASPKRNERTLGELEKLLGPGSVPSNSNRKALEDDLPNRIARVKDVVPVLRRAQVVRDLCVIARADGRADPAELRVLVEISDAIGVAHELVTCTAAAATELD
jgi:hypothetical protein